MPVRLMLSCTDAMISLMVYSETVYVLPSYSRSTRRGSPSALWRVWCVMEYDRKLMPHSWAACFTMAVLPTPGGPSRNIGRCISNGMRYAPLPWRERYAVMVSLTCCFADSISIDACLSPLRAPCRVVFPLAGRCVACRAFVRCVLRRPGAALRSRARFPLRAFEVFLFEHKRHRPWRHQVLRPIWCEDKGGFVRRRAFREAGVPVRQADDPV